jgi:hypothetical protein
LYKEKKRRKSRVHVQPDFLFPFKPFASFAVILFYMKRFRVAATGSSAPVIGLPTTSQSAPASNAARGVITRF